MDFNSILKITSKSAPVIEYDTDAGAFYVRFTSNKVKTTIERSCDKNGVCLIDMDYRGNLVGIELLGYTELILENVLKKNRIEAPSQMLAKSRIQIPQIATA